jgi:hypothetical protein
MSIHVPIGVADHASRMPAHRASNLPDGYGREGLHVSFLQRKRYPASLQQDILFFPGPEPRKSVENPLACVRGIGWALVLQAAALAAFVIFTFLL